MNTDLTIPRVRGNVVLQSAASSVALSMHAYTRFAERVVFGCDIQGAMTRLDEFLNHGRVQVEQPQWLADRRRDDADAYLLIGEDIAFPLIFQPDGCLLAVTCLTRDLFLRAARRRAMRGRCSR